jgi:peroxiredoxin
MGKSLAFRTHAFIRFSSLLPVVILLLGAGWIGLSAAEPGMATAGRIPAPRPGFLAPDFNLPTPQGDQITLSGLRGSPVIVNVWASWCAPCRAEMPALKRVYEDYRETGLVVLGVNATTQDSLDAALAFAGEMELAFPILLDEAGQALELYEVRAFPTTFFVDRQGLVREVVVGGPVSEALLRVRAEQLLGDP